MPDHPSKDFYQIYTGFSNCGAWRNEQAWTGATLGQVMQNGLNVAQGEGMAVQGESSYRWVGITDRWIDITGVRGSSRYHRLIRRWIFEIDGYTDNMEK